MQSAAKISRLVALFLALSFPSLTFAQHYTQTNLVTDMVSSAPVTDSNLKNAWGLSRNTGSPWWVSDNGTGVSTLYNITGTTSKLEATVNPLVVVIPPPHGSTSTSTPTGQVFNGSADFTLAPGIPARFIFVTEDGTISGWNQGFDPAHPNNAVLKVDNSPNAVYKGVTTGDVDGVRYLYVANFRSGHIEIYNTNFKAVLSSNDHEGDHHGIFSEESFDDGEIPEGYAPFNVQNIGGSLFVTYAKQDAPRMTTLPAQASALSISSAPPASSKAAWNMVPGSTPHGGLSGRPAISANSAIECLSEISAAVRSPHSTALPASSSD